LDDAGVVVPDGVYVAHVTASNAGGDADEISVRVGVDTRVPGVVTVPAPGDVVSGSSVGWVFTPTAGFGVDMVQVMCDGGSSSTAQAPVLGGPVSGMLDASSCRNGDNQVSGWVSWTDGFGGTHSWSFPVVPVMVVNPPVVSWSSAQEVYFSPNGDGQDDTVSWSYWLSQPADVDAWVTDDAGATVRVLESGVSHPASWSWYALSVVWDGLNDAGAVVPDGVYVAHLTASNAGGDADEISVRVGVDTRVPGALTVPAPGDTLAGLARFVYTPTNDLGAITSVRFEVSTGGGATSYNSLPDGTWRTSVLTGSLQGGPATVVAYVTWVDAFGAQHTCATPATAVVIDNTSLPLDVAASSTSGLAPLTSMFAIDTSDPQGLPVDYTINYGDGSALERGTAQNPYPTIQVAHTYQTPGAYQAIIMATNGQGASAVQQVAITALSVPNNPPTAMLAVTPTQGVAPVDVAASVDATDPDGDQLTYSIDFGDGSAVQQGSLPVADLGHTYTAAGTFSVRLEVSDGKVSVVRYAKVSVGLSQPLAASAGDDQTVAVNSPVAFDGSASVPAAAITSYRWDFGDGASADGARSSHSYAQAGTYTAKLTVASGTVTAVDTAMITVVSPPPAQGLFVTVTSGAALLAGADVMVIQADGSRVSGITDTTGQAVLAGLTDGSYTAYVWAGGFQPTTVTMTVTDGHGDATVDLVSGAAGATTLESHRMTVDEIQEAGIDLADPENYHIYEATINLHFVADQPAEDVTVWVSDTGSVGCIGNCGGVTGGGDGGGGGGGGASGPVWTLGEQKAIPTVIFVQGEPVIQWLVVPMRASFLKEFFQVQMVVQNLTTGFDFENGSAELSLPSGLSLAPTSVGQALTQEVASIPGGQSQTVTWLLRGDTEGEYDLSAVYNGSVEPIGEGITLTATTQSSLKVWGASALQTTITVDCNAQRWAPYDITIALKNVSGSDPANAAPVYNAQVELFDRPDSQTANDAEYFFAPGTQQAQGTAAIDPGQTFAAQFTIFPGIGSDQIPQMQTDLLESFVAQTGGDVDLHPVLQCANGQTSGQTAGAVNSVVQRVGGIDNAHITWDSASVWGSPRTTTPTYILVFSGPTAVDDATTVITAPPGTTLADLDSRCTLNDDHTQAACSSGHMDADSTVMYAYSVVVPPEGVTITGYEMWTRQTLSNGPWTQYDTLSPQDGGLQWLDIPSTQRVLGRYYGVMVDYSDGSRASSYSIGVGPSRYVSLGDSYSSGEGVPEFEPGTASDVDEYGGNTCHRSAMGSYGRLLLDDPSVTANLEPATFAACSGAVTADVTSPNPVNAGEPDQRSHVDQFTDVITLTMGGNDIGFADLAVKCVLLDCYQEISWKEAIGSTGFLDGLMQFVDQAHDALGGGVNTDTIVDCLQAFTDPAHAILCAYDAWTADKFYSGVADAVQALADFNPVEFTNFVKALGHLDPDAISTLKDTVGGMVQDQLTNLNVDTLVSLNSSLSSLDSGSLDSIVGVLADYGATALNFGPQGVIDLIDSAVSFNADRMSSLRYLVDGTLVHRLDSVFRSLAALAPNAKILVMPYPQLFDESNPTQDCLLGLGNLGFSGNERTVISELIDQLNDDIRQAVSAANSGLVGAPVQMVSPYDVGAQFLGKTLCKDGSLNGDSYFNGLVNPWVPLPGNKGPVSYSFHPNALGQQAYERALAPYINSAITAVTPKQTSTLASTFVPYGARQLHVDAAWPGSTVLLSVIAPDGTVYDAHTPGVSSGGDATSAWLAISNPMAGTWTPQVYGEDVAENGEDVQVTTSIDLVIPSPEASVLQTVSPTDPRTVTFDASGSTSAQGTLSYSWVFSDGSFDTGAVVTHTFPADVPMWATLRLDDGVSIPTWLPGVANSVPVAMDDVATVVSGEALTVDAPGVLANDTDVDGNALTAVLGQPPSHGTVTLDADGSYVYTPVAGFVGTDQFTYVANDGTVDSLPATVTITVTQADVQPTPTPTVTPTGTPTPTQSQTPTGTPTAPGSTTPAPTTPGPTMTAPTSPVSPTSSATGTSTPSSGTSSPGGPTSTSGGTSASPTQSASAGESSGSPSMTPTGSPTASGSTSPGSSQSPTGTSTPSSSTSGSSVPPSGSPTGSPTVTPTGSTSVSPTSGPTHPTPTPSGTTTPSGGASPGQSSSGASSTSTGSATGGPSPSVSTGGPTQSASGKPTVSPSQSPSGTPTETPTPEPIIDVPTSGVAIATQASTRILSFTGSGFVPGQSVTARIVGASVDLPPAVATLLGTVTFQWTVPDGFAVGDYVIQMSSGATTVSQTFTISELTFVDNVSNAAGPGQVTVLSGGAASPDWVPVSLAILFFLVGGLGLLLRRTWMARGGHSANRRW